MINEIVSPSPNFGKRGSNITCIIIHDTESKTASSALDWFSRKESAVSAHVVIDKDGKVYRVVPDDKKAWHAGVSSLFGDAVGNSVNDFSLGVELVDDDDTDPYPQAQLDAAAEWVASKVKQYGIPLNRIVGHNMVAPGRKVDPGKDFPWTDFLLEVASKVTS